MTIARLKELKRELGLTNEMISKASGVPLGTVQKIFSGTTKSPRRATLLALENALLAKSSLTSAFVYDAREKRISGSSLREAPASYGAPPAEWAEDPGQGHYTLEDYYALPEERRVELIDGVIYDMSSPTGYHQLIAGELYSMLLADIRSRKGSCMPFISPIDVCLDRDNKTMVQPDVFILCDKSKYTPRRIEGAPDFIAEVLSPSSKSRDLFIKLNKYRNAGVREYWAIDPEKKIVMVYVFENDDDFTCYSFRDRIPVAIYHGEMIVDFSLIDDVISEWM